MSSPRPRWAAKLLQVWLPLSLVRGVALAALRRRTSKSAIVRLAIADYLAAQLEPDELSRLGVSDHCRT
jgi:hypothetical protein